MASDPLTAGQLDRQRLRALYSSFPTGVTICTTIDADGRPWGMTASSFYSISLEPPLISISLTHATPSFDAFANSEEFAISILSESQAHLASQFAMTAPDKFDGVELETTPYRSPVIAASAAWLICTPKHTIEIGDHTLLVAEVQATRVYERQPLIYARGTFSGLDATRAETGAEIVNSRRTLAGFIVERDDAIALVPDVSRSDSWSLPISRLQPGHSTSESLSATAARLFHAPIETDFLHSIVDLDDRVTCMVYRGSLLDEPHPDSRVRWFAPEDIPWKQLSNRQVGVILRRYLKERVADQFGVYVNAGRGRIATITTEEEWLPTAAQQEELR